MKHNGTEAELKEINDDTDKLTHAAELHEFSADEETCLTAAGDCPHCDDRQYASIKSSRDALLACLLAATGVLAILGHAGSAIALLGLLIVWSAALDELPKYLHKTLQQVGL